jgi:hypothetical protein
LAVRLVFDPPATSFTLDAFKRQKEELEWRLNVAAENEAPPPSTGGNATLWVVSNEDEFPPEAAVGDLGLDPVTGDVWRNA